MKIFTFLLFCSFIIFINTLNCDDNQNPSSFSDCENLSVSDGNKCCYIYFVVDLDGQSEGFPGCGELTKEEYENKDKTISQMKEATEKGGMIIKSLNIVCDSSETSNTSENSETSECFDNESASSANDCKNLSVEDGNHCCFQKVKVEEDGKTYESETCVEITDEVYDKLDDYIDDAKDYAEKKGAEYKELKIDCNSSFLTNSLFGLILFLL